MDNKSEIEKRFIFHGNAVAFAAHVRRPEDFFIPAVASSCLPVTGGLAEAVSGPQRFKEISFESASTRAHGDYADSRRAVDFTHGNFGENLLPTNTFVESKLKGLKIEIPQPAAGGAAPAVRRFSVENLYVRLESSSDRRSPISFRSLEVAIEGVEVDGHRLKVITTDASRKFGEYDTHAKLVEAYEKDGDFRQRYGKCFYPTGQEKTGLIGRLGKHEIPNGNGIVLGTVVTGLEWEKEAAADTVIAGNRLTIEGIGTIFFGEIIIETGARRVTLLRCQLGSPDGADMSACDVQSNGQDWPPAS
jgi:hypothetical protein